MKGRYDHMKKAYQTPDIDILYLNVADIIATSGMGELEDDYADDNL